jgi:hypothetical protein
MCIALTVHNKNMPHYYYTLNWLCGPISPLYSGYQGVLPGSEGSECVNLTAHLSDLSLGIPEAAFSLSDSYVWCFQWLNTRILLLLFAREMNGIGAG